MVQQGRMNTPQKYQLWRHKGRLLTEIAIL